MSANEITHVYDADGNITGTMTRDEAEATGQVISVVVIFIFDTAGRVWIQLRPQDKKNMPGLWDVSVCGGIVHEETPDEAAIRELYEETGIATDLQFVEAYTQVMPAETRRPHIFIGITDDQPRTNPEVDEFRALHPEQVRQHAVEHPELYTPPFLIQLDKAVVAYRNLAV